MKIINKTKGYIYYTTSYTGAGDCGFIEQNKEQYLGYPAVPVSVSISFQQPSASASKEAEAETADASSFVYWQNFTVNGSDDVTVSIGVSS